MLSIVKEKVSMCSSKADTKLEMDNQISNFMVAEDAVRVVGGGSHMLFPSNAEAKLTSCNHFHNIFCVLSELQAEH